MKALRRGSAQAWVRRIDLDTFKSTVFELSEGTMLVTVGRKDADIIIDSPRLSGKQCAFVSDGGRWRVEDLTSAGGTFLNGRRVHRHTLVHGDTLWLYDVLLVFLESSPITGSGPEANLDADPDDRNSVQVWADWLQERGDPLGEHLLAAAPVESVLDGLFPLVKDGRLELSWRHGLIHTARLRCINDATYSDVELIARFLSLRVARWTRELTVDLSTWVMPSANRIHQDAAAVLKGLLTGPHLPALEHLSFGYFTEPLPPSVFLLTMLDRLRARFPKLKTNPRLLLAPARFATLEILAIPGELDFHAPGAKDARIPLDSGLWVGSSARGQLRALAPGVHRSGVVESFLVRQQSPQWCLIPLEHGVLLNGRPAVETRLLPGDVIEEPRGTRFRFDVR
ncbi:MAG: FHA domain-containing protein [Archangium sp.]|nr:FHA domain-containing protein [Archangium sp.]